MRRILLFLLIVFLSTGQNESKRLKRQTHRSYTQPRTHTRTTPDGVPILSESYARSRAASAATRQNRPSHSDGLTLYEDFVNDPWKPTEDLHSILSERRTSYKPQRELRAGQRATDRDELWNRPNPSSRRNYVPTTAATYFPTQPPTRGHEWYVSSRAGDHVTYVRRKSNYERQNTDENPQRLRSWDSNYANYDNFVSYPHGKNGDAEWIVESESDGHITYRRRGSWPRNQYWRTTTVVPQIQRLGRGSGEVLARVVNTGDDSEGTSARLQQSPRQDFFGPHAGYNPRGSFETWRPKVELKSGKSVSFTDAHGTQMTFPRYRDDDRVRALPAQFSTQRPYTYQHPTTTTPPTYYRGGPHYPMLHEKETADRANRLGATNKFALVY